MIQTCERSVVRMVRAALLGFLVIVTATRPGSGQGTGDIQGHVRDKAGKRVSVARVVVSGTSYVGTTDTAGAYRIRGVPAGTYDLRAGGVGFKAAEVKGVRVTDGQVTTVDVTLDATAAEGADIVATRRGRDAGGEYG